LGKLQCLFTLFQAASGDHHRAHAGSTAALEHRLQVIFVQNPQHVAGVVGEVLTIVLPLAVVAPSKYGVGQIH
jgi:hypothetical protein